MCARWSRRRAGADAADVRRDAAVLPRRRADGAEDPRAARGRRRAAAQPDDEDPQARARSHAVRRENAEYFIRPAVARRINLGDATPTKVSQLTVPLNGTRFDVDFNLAANRLRVVRTRGQNLRHNIDDPVGAPAIGVTVADTQLTTPPNARPPRGDWRRVHQQRRRPTTATTLFVSTRAGSGQRSSPRRTRAPWRHRQPGRERGQRRGLRHQHPAGAAERRSGLAALQVNGTYSLYEIDLITGRATQAGAFPVDEQVTDLTTGI